MIDALLQSVAAVFAFSLGTVRALTAGYGVLAVAALAWLVGLVVVVVRPT
jgi:hypothetical protein